MVTVDLSEADEGATLAAMTALPPPTRSQTAQVASLLNLMRAEQDNRRRAQTAAAELQAEVEELRRENSRVAHALQERTAQQKESERNARMQTVLYRQREQEQTATCEDLARRLQQSTEGPAPRPPFSEAESTSTSELFRVLTQSASDWEQVSRYESQQPFFSGATTPDASPAEVTEVHPSASQSRSHRSSTSRQSMSSAVEANEDGHPHAASWATPRLASEASHDSRPSSAGLLSQLTGMSFFREVGVLPEGSEPAGGQEAKELPTVAEPAETSQELIQNEVPLFGLSLARLEDMNPAVAVEPEAAAQEEVEVSAAPEPLQAVSVEVAEEEIGSPAAFELAPAESEEGNFLTPAKIEEVAQEDVEVPDPLEPAQGVSDEATEETGLPAASQLPEAGSEEVDVPVTPAPVEKDDAEKEPGSPAASESESESEDSNPPDALEPEEAEQEEVETPLTREPLQAVWAEAEEELIQSEVPLFGLSLARLEEPSTPAKSEVAKPEVAEPDEPESEEMAVPVVEEPVMTEAAVAAVAWAAQEEAPRPPTSSSNEEEQDSDSDSDSSESSSSSDSDEESGPESGSEGHSEAPQVSSSAAGEMVFADQGARQVEAELTAIDEGIWAPDVDDLLDAPQEPQAESEFSATALWRCKILGRPRPSPRDGRPAAAPQSSSRQPAVHKDAAPRPPGPGTAAGALASLRVSAKELAREKLRLLRQQRSEGLLVYPKLQAGLVSLGQSWEQVSMERPLGQALPLMPMQAQKASGRDERGGRPRPKGSGMAKSQSLPVISPGQRAGAQREAAQARFQGLPVRSADLR